MKAQQLKQLIREEIKNITKSLTEGKYDADLDKIETAVKNASSFMNVGAELKKAGIKYDFSTSMIPMYTVKVSGNKIAIVNKKYAAGAEREVKDIAIGLLEGVNESVNEGIGREAMGIAAFTGTRGIAVQKFIDDFNLNAKKLFNFISKGKLKDRMDFATAISGKPGNKYQDNFVGMFGESKVTEATLTEKKYYVTYNRGRGQGKDLEKEFDQKTFKTINKPKVFNSYNDAKKYAEKMEKMFRNSIGGGTAYWVSDEKMNPIKDAKSDYESVIKESTENFIGAALVKKSGMVKDLDSLEKEPIYVRDVLPIYRKEGSSYVVKSSLTGNALKVPVANLIVKMKDQFEPDKWAKFISKVSRY